MKPKVLLIITLTLFTTGCIFGNKLECKKDDQKVIITFKDDKPHIMTSIMTQKTDSKAELETYKKQLDAVIEMGDDNETKYSYKVNGLTITLKAEINFDDLSDDQKEYMDEYSMTKEEMKTELEEDGFTCK